MKHLLLASVLIATTISTTAVALPLGDSVACTWNEPTRYTFLAPVGDQFPGFDLIEIPVVADVCGTITLPPTRGSGEEGRLATIRLAGQVERDSFRFDIYELVPGLLPELSEATN